MGIRISHPYPPSLHKVKVGSALAGSCSVSSVMHIESIRALSIRQLLFSENERSTSRADNGDRNHERVPLFI